MSSADTHITLAEAAERLGVHYMTAYRYVRTGRLPGVKQGSEWRVDPADLVRVSAPEGQPGRGRRQRGSRTVYPSRLEDRLVHGDEGGAWTIVENAMASGMTADEIYREVIAPAMASIGTRWEAGSLTVDQEHLASNVVVRLIGRLGPQFVRRGRKRGAVVLGAPPGDAHSLPTAMVADLLRGRGFEVIDLGADVPAPSFANAVRATDRLLGVGLCATTPGNSDNIADALVAIRAATDAPVVLGGLGITDAVAAKSLGADWHTATIEEVLDRFERVAEGETPATDAPEHGDTPGRAADPT